MALRAAYFKRVFQFNFKARTSRGLMRDKTSWFIKLWQDAEPSVSGVGESGPLPGLSIDARPDFEEVLQSTIGTINSAGNIATWEQLHDLIPTGFPSILFALETAWLDLQNGGKRLIFDNSFVQGNPIPINGLIWMGDMDFTMSQINQKVAEGFRCIKLKVGGLDFDRECDVLQYIRKRYFREDITIRLDANGAFKIDEALYKLTELSRFKIHSIEQPIKPGLEVMEELCRKSPVPVAFDEELIGKESKEDKTSLLNKLKPQYIILKPTLHGGLAGCAEWITLAETFGIGWWITSALESNLGLNAICQFTANYNIQIPQGLGTGMIYNNNISAPLEVSAGTIAYNREQLWEAFDV